jgi:class 3 adenylate cyclase/predicted ATPase
MRCPSCHHDNRAERRFCAECGAPLEARCASCGAANNPGRTFCGGCGARLATDASRAAVASKSREPEAALPTGERRQLTVLFCDLVGSTALSRQLDPEDWRDVVAQYQATMRAAVERFGGHVAKDLGDGLLVYFGWPTAREDDPERAIRAGLAMLDAMGPLNAQLAAGDGTRLAVRIGMHTGPVVVADGDIFGDTANITARVQSAAEPDTVFITAATQRLVAGIFVVEERGPQMLKGVRGPVTLYRVVRPSGVRSRLDVAAGRLTPFVGREVELATLVERWERAADGEGQTVLIVGEAGVGKSRLAYELRERSATVPHTWLECGATPYTESTPFHPVIALVAQGLAFTPEDTAGEKLDKITLALERAGLASTEAVALVADFLGLEAPVPLAMAPEVQRRKTIELLVAWNLAMSETQPLVVLVEDLHWCDPSSLELLGRLTAQTATARMLLLGTTRPEFVAPWPARSNLTTVQLARLTKRHARAMVAALGAGALPEAMVEMLVARADGMPLYVEELTKAVVEPGAARGSEAIPPTLADSLMARLDRLSSAKEVAQQAAVLGREFPYALLAAVGGMEEAVLRQGLARLVDAEILYARGEPPHAIYTFKHALVQEAAYGSLLKRTRQQLHGRVVEVLRERFPKRTAAEPEVVARHAEAAGRVDDAITYYGLAGEQAQARSADEEAIGQFRKAIALLETRAAGPERDARELTLQLAFAGSLIAARGYSHAETGAAYERAVALAATEGSPAQLGTARTGLALVHYTRGELERARELLGDVLEAAEARDDREQRVICYMNLGAIEHYQGKFVSSLERQEQALALYDSVPHDAHVRMIGTQGVAALGIGAWDLWHLGRPDAALARVHEAVALARRLAYPFSLALALLFEIAVHWMRRDGAAQRERAAQLIALSKAQGFPLWLGLGRAFHAAPGVTDGDYAALTEIMEGFALAAKTGNQAAAPGLMVLLADAQRAAGQLVAAQGTVAAGLAVAAHTGQLLWDADLHRLDGELLLATGGVADEAAARYHRALAIAREQGARSVELRAATSLARLLREQGRTSEARDLLTPVYASFTEGFDTGDLQDAKALLADLT